ncbi:Retrovirus-related Pol polyprotein from transposon RE1 [Vitis vinifera]|uniref:Retrovirus-related Pol polyprotein from transposon RE1 n=1 Tax=Vitis vinifera TaxID=29760 RepID=A0A438EDL4_VITVI|nr:Retrovirus-related Pol polyprotein from transposon RE1 [Vitis vinifera]
MIMSWLINSMNNDIGENFLLFGTAKDIWDAAKETYSSSENISELFQVESALHDFRQGEQSVTQYYNTLTRYWQQLDLFETHSWKCSDDAATYRQIVEQKRLFKEAFSEVRREESRKKVMMGSKEQPAPTLDGSALAARSFNSSGGDRQKRDRPWCDYCKKPGHYKEACWKLHGKPADWKPKPRSDRDGRAHVAANSESTSVPERSRRNEAVIVDTGASNHMTGDAAILQNYKPRLESGKMIGSAELCSGLYLLSCGQFSNQVSQASCVQSQILKSDNAKEYFTSSLSTYLQNHGIIHISSCVDTPQQNGVAERKNRHLLEVARCLMFSSNVPNYFWGEAILTATYLINRMPSRVLTFQSPRQLFLKQFPHTHAASSDLPLKGESMNEHQVWESFLRVYLLFTQSHQILPNSRPLSCPHPCRISQPAQHTNVPSPVTIQSPMPIQPIAPQLANENLQVYIRRRKRQELEHGSQSTCGQYIDSNSSLPEENIDHPIGNYVTYEGLSPSYRAFATSLDDTQVPNTIQEALKISEWKKAVQDEIDALEKNGTWTITDLPVGKRPVGCKWIFTIKYKADGSVEDSRLDPSLIGCQSRLVLATTGHKKCVSKWDLEEEVYMEIPPGFEESMAKNQNLKKYLSEEFEVKDLGNLKYFLGMEVARSRKGIVVSQRKYILDLLKETGMLGCKPIDTPMDSQKKLGIEKESTPVDRGRYQRLVGRLIYLSHTRPDIGFAVSAVSQFMHSPTEEHMEAVYRILRYLKMTPGKGLFFRKTENRDTEVYSDADWAGNIIDRRSTSGYCSLSGEILLPGGVRSNHELGQTSSSPILMMCDNLAAISIAKNPVHHDRTKHVEIDRHFITEKVTSETVKLNYVPTKHQTADILTKALPRPNFEDLTCKLGLYDIYSPA